MKRTKLAAMAGQEEKPKDGQSDVWLELFGTVDTLSETVDLALQAFAPESADKVCKLAQHSTSEA